MTNSWLSAVLMFVLGICTISAEAWARVETTQTKAGWELRLDGKPFVWHGVAFESSPKGSISPQAQLAALAKAGATVIRVYREEDAWVLDEAQKVGLKVVMGLWLGHPRHGFDYNDPKQVAEQSARIESFVTKYKSHPALLAWGVGNEVEATLPDPRQVWAAVEAIAARIKRLDPDHPTIMVMEDAGQDRYRLAASCCTSVDILGINIYAGAAFDLPERLKSAGVVKPVIVSELGPLGQWQAGRKPWGAPVELTSTQKADFFRKAIPFLEESPQIIGTFPFLWGAKQEQTATWHGLLLADGSRTEMSDVLIERWSGKPIAYPAPVVRGIGINADVFAPGAEVSSTIDVAAPDGTPLKIEWSIYQEADILKKGGDEEPVPPRLDVPMTISRDGKAASFPAPLKPGAYRLFGTVRNAHDKAATFNLPFLVQ